MALTARVEVRRQSPKACVFVHLFPDDVDPVCPPNHFIAQQRGIKVIYVGEGYCKNAGRKSSLGRAIARAHKLAAQYNGAQQ